MVRAVRKGLIAFAAILAFTSGCDLAKFTVNSVASVNQRAAPSVDEHWDQEFVGDALPAQVMQIEGLLRVSPQNELLHLQGVRAYTSYAFGWVEDDAERREARGDSAGARKQRERAIHFYLRAVRLGKRLLDLETGEFYTRAEGELPAFEAWLADEFDDEEDAPALFWVGYAWGLYINARYPTEQNRERGFAIALVKRSVALDPDYYGGSGLGVLAFVATQRPGADLDEARAAWDRALAASGRRNLLALVTMARVYAVERGDRALFDELIAEVLAAGDIYPEMRLSNKIAQRRARRYRAQADQLF